MSDSKAVSAQKNSMAYPWLVVGLLCVVGCLNYLDRMMITTMRSSIVEAIPMTDAQFGLLTSLFLWIYGFLSPVGGYFADRFRRSWVIIGSLFVWSLVTWLTSYATTFEGLLLSRALMGISEACYIPAGLALIMDYHKGATRSLATGIHMGGIMIGQSLGFIGGQIAENHSWNYAFSIFGFIGIGYVVVLLFFLRDSPDREMRGMSADIAEAPSPSFFVTIRALLANAEYRKVIALWGLGGVVSWLVVGWLPTYFKETFRLSQTDAGLYAAGYFHFASLGGVLAGGFLADQWSRRSKRGRIFTPMMGLLISAPAVFVASSTTVLYVAVASFMVFAFFRIFLDANMMPILAMIINPRYLATGYGVLNLLSCVVGGVGLYAAGALRDADVNLSLLFKISAALILVNVFILYKMKPKS